MFPVGYWPAGYWGPRYWGTIGTAPPPAPPVTVPGAGAGLMWGIPKRERKKPKSEKILLKELADDENEEAAAIAMLLLED